MYLETRFMNFVQAVEGYHRRRLNRTMYDDATFESYRDAILEHVSGRTRRLAKKALRYANEASLEDRIKDVLQELGDSSHSIVLAGAAATKLDADGFANRVAYRRNVFAHNLNEDEPEDDEDEDDAEYEPHPRELAIFMFQLKTLVQALLLLELGFDQRAINKKLEESGSTAASRPSRRDDCVVTYYMNLFTAETWREIRENAKFEYRGHRDGARNREKVRPGDVLLCYVTRTSAFVGALEVTSDVYEIDHEDEPTWSSDLYPVRFKTRSCSFACQWTKAFGSTRFGTKRRSAEVGLAVSELAERDSRRRC